MGIGSVVGDVTINQIGRPAPARPVRSKHLENVRHIAPRQLLERQAELTELARFCLDDDRGPYVWWQAGPWAGKTALLATFVLHPPEKLAERVRIVSFFVTARLTSQDTRESFRRELLEQLCALTGQPFPPTADATRDAVLLDLLRTTAATCQAAEQRLVLVVDGLDEDRGVTTGPAAQSIAALLPGTPPAGLRIIVASRPNPPIPDDVPDWHPLRDRQIIRRLSDSPHARDLERLSKAELHDLLKGTALERDLVGLLAAAQGGLSGPDLREITGADLVDVEDVLHTVTGRTFTRRMHDWGGETAPEVYLLGHEELHTAAVHYLSRIRLSQYRDRLHAWADGYRTAERRWPASVPGYLLTDYPGMLRDTGDVGRLLALATDPIRHDRMLDLSGGDVAALTEIIAAQDLLLTRSEPDLLALARLSIHRSELAERNHYLPIELPAVWAVLGRPDRAEALVRSIPESHPELNRRDRALTELELALVAAGEIDRAVSLVKTLPDPAVPALTTAELVRAVATAGDLDRAEALADTFTGSGLRTWALAALAPVVAAAGDLERAEAIVRTLSTPEARHHALAGLAEAIAAAGDVDRAEAIARTITNTRRMGEALTALAPLVVTAGDPDRAEALADTITDPYTKAKVLAALAQASARDGDNTRAKRLAAAGESATFAKTDPYWQASALAELIQAMAAAGDRDGVVRLVGIAETVAGAIHEGSLRAQRLTEIARAMAAAGDPDRAEAIARTITDPDHRTAALAQLISVVADTDTERARQLATAAEAVAHTITNPYTRAGRLIGLMRAVATAGDLDRAEAIACAITIATERARALARLARVIATADPERARRLAVATETLAHTIDNFYTQYKRANALTGLIRAVATAGDLNRARQLTAAAERVAHTITDDYYRTDALVELASAIAATAATAATDRIDKVKAIADTITSPPAWAQVKLVSAIAVAGDPDQAELFAATITIADMHVEALADLADLAAARGEYERAHRLARSAENTAHGINPRGRVPGSYPRDDGLFAAARAMAVAGDLDRAETIVRDAYLPREGARALLALAAAADLHRAETIAHTIPAPDGRTAVLARLALTAVRRGHPDDARRLTADAEHIANSIPSTGRHEEALAALVPAMASLGDLDRAESICGSLTNSDERARALTEIADFADPPRAHRLLGEAFAAGSWLVPLPVLAKLQPHVAIQIADELAGALTSRPT